MDKLWNPYFFVPGDWQRQSVGTWRVFEIYKKSPQIMAASMVIACDSKHRRLWPSELSKCHDCKRAVHNIKVNSQISRQMLHPDVTAVLRQTVLRWGKPNRGESVPSNVPLLTLCQLNSEDWVSSWEATNTIFIVFGQTQLWIEPTTLQSH